MANMEEIQKNIAAISAGLKNHQETIKKILSHPVFLSWQQFDFKESGADLKELGLPIDAISQAITLCKTTGQKCHKDIRHVTNVLANLKADLTGHCDMTQAAALAKKHQTAYEVITHDITKLTSQARVLITAKKKLSKSLTLHNIFSLARKCVGRKTDFFDQGLEVFTYFFPDQSSKNSPNILREYADTGKKIEARFDAIELPALPNIATEIITHHIAQGKHTAQQVSLFAEAIAGRFISETSTKNLLCHQIETLRDEAAIPIIAEKIKKIATSLGELVLYLFNKNSVLARLPMIPETYEYLTTYQLFIKNSLLEKVSQQVTAVSEINPSTMALQETHTFFYGIKGMMRTFKLMYSSLKGKEAINEAELQLLLEKAVTSCHIFYGESRDDVHRLKEFINGLLKQYARPFPYNPLFKMVKTTIANYGNAVEAFVLSLDIDEKYRHTEEYAIPSSFGKLVALLQENDAVFTKFVTTLNK